MQGEVSTVLCFCGFRYEVGNKSQLGAHGRAHEEFQRREKPPVVYCGLTTEEGGCLHRTTKCCEALGNRAREIMLEMAGNVTENGVTTFEKRTVIERGHLNPGGDSIERDDSPLHSPNIGDCSPDEAQFDIGVGIGRFEIIVRFTPEKEKL